MAQEHNRKAVAKTVHSKCFKRYAKDPVKASACVRGTSEALARSANGSGFAFAAKVDCQKLYDYADPDTEDACIKGVEMFKKGIQHIGPRLAGKRKRR